MEEQARHTSCCWMASFSRASRSRFSASVSVRGEGVPAAGAAGAAGAAATTGAGASRTGASSATGPATGVHALSCRRAKAAGWELQSHPGGAPTTAHPSAMATIYLVALDGDTLMVHR